VSLDDNKAIIRAYVETVWNQHQLDRADEFMAPDFLDHASLPGQAPGLQGATKKWAMYQTGLPDLRVTINDLVAEGDKVGVRRTYQGHPWGGAAWRPAHRQARADRRHQHLPPGRGEDRRKLGAGESAGHDAAARRPPHTGAGDTVGPAGFI
jgi:predicted ester cyclase